MSHKFFSRRSGPAAAEIERKYSSPLMKEWRKRRLKFRSVQTETVILGFRNEQPVLNRRLMQFKLNIRGCEAH
ncbi:UNVERIFIED_CONTAM: hypothetical protein PYX00_005732 [Menopon gallinae]|uniref:Uncharacterized protein n=1 Tax=Menopon gallinae TaxID=328185 RepID=A0AAW2HSS0_9NEOP